MAATVLNQRRSSIWGLLALAAAGATALGVFSYLSYIRERIPVLGPMVPVVVAGEDLEPGTSLTAAMLDTVEHPGRYRPAQSLSRIADAQGKVLKVPVRRGEPINAYKFGETGGPSALVPAGQRAYSLAISSGAGLGFTPRPGDKVDVLAYLPREALGEAAGVTVLRSKPVASVGPPMGSSQEPGERPGIREPGAPNLSVTLFVSPVEAQRLAVAEAMGRITVVLAPESGDPGPAPGPVTVRDVAES